MIRVIHGRQGRLVEQRPVHLYDPINDHVASELQERSVPPKLANPGFAS